MYLKLLLCTILLHLLIPLEPCNGTEIAGEIANNGFDNHNHNDARDDIRIEQVLDSHSSSHMHHHMDPATIVFFFLEDLTLGNTMPIYFPKRKLSDSLAHLLPKQEADSIPFSSDQLDYLLTRFDFSKHSPQANAMRDTLDECERRPIRGETKFCATSWESLSDFLKTIFVSNPQIKLLSTTHAKRASLSSDNDDDALLQKYTIVGINQIPAPKLVSCHTMPYAYAVFFCHYQESENRVYSVALTGDNGDEVEAIGVCHMDTSQWSRTHVAFEVLGVEPGSAPVCHFFPADNFVWVPMVQP